MSLRTMFFDTGRYASVNPFSTIHIYTTTKDTHTGLPPGLLRRLTYKQKASDMTHTYTTKWLNIHFVQQKGPESLKNKGNWAFFGTFCSSFC